MAIRPAGETVRLIDKPPSTDTIGQVPLRFDGNLVEVEFDNLLLLNLITVTGIKKSQFRILFGSSEETFT